MTKLCAWNELTLERRFLVLEEVSYWGYESARSQYYMTGEIPPRVDTPWAEVVLYAFYNTDMCWEDLTALRPGDFRIQAFARGWNDFVASLE